MPVVMPGDSKTDEAKKTSEDDATLKTNDLNSDVATDAKDDGSEVDKWRKVLDEMPDEVRNELLQGKDSGLKSALEKEREEKRKYERELKRIERERQLADDNKAKEKGEYKELLEKREAELKELQARLEAEEWTKQTRSRLKEAGYSDLEDILLASRETPDDVASTAKRLDEYVKVRVDAEVNKRLETGSRVRTNGSATPSKAPSKMTINEKLAFIGENGRDAWEKAVLAEGN